MPANVGLCVLAYDIVFLFFDRAWESRPLRPVLHKPNRQVQMSSNICECLANGLIDLHVMM